MDNRTERITKSLFFIDVISLGLIYKTKQLFFNIRPTLRHFPNADLQLPNTG